MERKLDKFIQEFRDGKHEGSTTSTQTVESIPADERLLWKQIRKDLESIGISVKAFEANKAFIFNWFTQAVEAGSFQEQISENNIGGNLSQRLPIHDLSTDSAVAIKQPEVIVSHPLVPGGLMILRSGPTSALPASIYGTWKGFIKTRKGENVLAASPLKLKKYRSNRLRDLTANLTPLIVQQSEIVREDVLDKKTRLISPLAPENLNDASLQGDCIRAHSLLTQGADVNARANNSADDSEEYETALKAFFYFILFYIFICFVLLFLVHLKGVMRSLYVFYRIWS